MKNLIKKLFNPSKKNILTYNSFEKLKKETEILKIFQAISKYSKNSEIRYVGGCIRKILNKEKIDDIDLAVNLDPKIVCDILKKENIKYFESGIKHGTITSTIGNKKFTLLDLLNLKNDLEITAIRIYPSLKVLKKNLQALPKVKFVRMTGSGSAFVAYFLSKIDATNAYKIFRKKYKNYWSIVSKTI